MAKATGKRAAVERYVLLPPQGLRASGPGTTPAVQAFLRAAAKKSSKGGSLALGGRQSLSVRVLDSISDDGAKLIEATPEAAMAIRSGQPGLQVVPLAYYDCAVAPRPEIREAPKTAKAAADITLQVVSKADKKPVAGAFVLAFTDYAAGTGVQDVTDAEGRVSLGLGAGSVTLDRLYVYPVDAYWTLRKKGAAIKSGGTVAVEPIDLGYVDGVRHYYPDSADDAGKGVTVAVIDTGIADHPDLVVAGGANTVAGEDPKDYGDNGQNHGTHVAGILAARGRPPTGIRGVAPGVTLRSYRVFAEGSRQADSFAIAKAVDLAVADKCDLINMSLGGGMYDPVLEASISDARARGSLCIIAAGNGSRKPVSFPAKHHMAIAVSALGRKGTFPSNTAETDEVVAPFGTDKAEFIGAFSNFGAELDLAGPGVGIISTVPGTYAEISGTSMACPAVTGAAARLLASGDLLKKKRNAVRSEEMVKALLASAKARGLGEILEGHGLPLPS